MGFMKLMHDGGFVMYPLLICSLLVWAVIFDRAWGVFYFARKTRILYEKALELLKERKVSEAKGLFASVTPLISAPHIALLDHCNDKEACERKLAHELQLTFIGLKRFLWILATIASLAPFLGLFGTVSGIINSFESMAMTGKGGFSVVASGIAEALISTAAGILVAIVALIFYNFFTVRINSLFVSFKKRIEDLAEHL